MADDSDLPVAETDPGFALPLADHPLRRSLVEELHVRRFPPFTSPARLVQLVMLSGEGTFADDRAAADSLCARFGAPTHKPGKHFVADLGELTFVWERHTEYCTYTFIKPGAAIEPFTRCLLGELPPDWLAAVPGTVLRATQIEILDPATPEPLSEDLARWFRDPDLVTCTLMNGGARIWTEFEVYDDGLGRVLVRDQGLSAGDLSRLVQQLQELGNYRNMALLGFPDAQRLTPAVSALESELAALANDLARPGVDDERLLQELSTLSAELARLTASTRYRMSATRAYLDLATDRLKSLGAQRIAGYQTLADFTERRLVPAARTCDSFNRRLGDLTDRASWASSLLRTRVETALESQNRDLLASMNHRTDMQLRLQQTVEGLSVVAISYYAIGLVGYATKAVHDVLPVFDPTVATGAAVPISIGLVWLFLRRVKTRLHQPE
jgi:uncharacterized membrane-anchored protein